MKERQSDSYQNRHKTSITLDHYKGVGSGVMELNDPIADGFMSTADMRNNIVIVKKYHDRVQDYDQVGHIRVAKMLKLPDINLWDADKTISTKKEGDTFLIAVDDQEISQRVANRNDGKKSFEELFVADFQKEVRRGLSNCLKREKILNGGSYGLVFLTSYHFTGLFDIYALPAVTFYDFQTGGDPLIDAGRTLAVYGGIHLISNTVNWLWVGLSKTSDMINPYPLRTRLTHSDDNEPFVKRSPADFLMPSVPLDKLLRGELYLKGKGRKLITYNK